MKPRQDLRTIIIGAQPGRLPCGGPDDLCNRLQVAASALHLIDRQIDEELRPLIRIGLAAIRHAAADAHRVPALSAVHRH